MENQIVGKDKRLEITMMITVKGGGLKNKEKKTVMENIQICSDGMGIYHSYSREQNA